MSATKISELTSHTTPDNTDVVPIVDTPNTTTKKITWSNIKATLKTYFDTLYGAGTVTTVSVTTANGVSGSVATATTTPAITLSLGAITPSSVQVSGLTASELIATDASKNLQSLPVATYPSLTELSYLKGVTSSIQTQLNSSGVTDYSCRVYQTGTTSITSSWVAIAFGAENFDTDTMHDNVTNNTRITFTHAGKYMVGGGWYGATNSVSGTRIKLNGSTVIATQIDGNAGASLEYNQVSTLYNFSASDYIELEGYSGTTQNTSGDSNTHFWAFKVA